MYVTRMHSSRMRTARSLPCGGGEPLSRGICQGDCPPCGLTDACENITLHQTSFTGGNKIYANRINKVMPSWVPYYYSLLATCMLPPHQLRHINSALAYILLPGHVTCKACWDTTAPPVDRQTPVKT